MSGCLLQATRAISEILLQSTCPREVEAIFPRLFLALLFQVSFTTELTLQEVHIFWREHQQDLLTPVRCSIPVLISASHPEPSQGSRWELSISPCAGPRCSP